MEILSLIKLVWICTENYKKGLKDYLEDVAFLQCLRSKLASCYLLSDYDIGLIVRKQIQIHSLYKYINNTFKCVAETTVCLKVDVENFNFLDIVEV